MAKCEYQEGFCLPESRTSVENNLVKRYCGKPAKKFEYWFMCPKHIRAVLKRLDLIKQGKLVVKELKIKTVRRDKWLRGTHFQNT